MEMAIITLICAITALIFSVFAGWVYPHYLAPKPKITVGTSFSEELETSRNTYTVTNVGNAPAKDIGFYFELRPDVKITSITLFPNAEGISGGVGEAKVELQWQMLGPRDTIIITLVTNKPKGFPIKAKIWDNVSIAYEGIIR